MKKYCTINKNKAFIFLQVIIISFLFISLTLFIQILLNSRFTLYKTDIKTQENFQDYDFLDEIIKQEFKNIEEKILMADEEIKQLQNKRKKLISQQKQEKRKKRDKRIYEKGAVFESIFTESKNLTKDEFYQLVTSLIRKEEANIKILKIIESREETEVENTEKEDEETEIEE